MKTTNNKITNILVVDDDPIAIFLAKELLEGKFNAIGVTNGYDAVKALEENYFDIILMDINLGDDRMDGLRTMRLIRQTSKFKRVKIIALTAHAHNREFYIKQGFDELHLKPINEELFEKINNLLSNSTNYLNHSV